MCVPAPAHRLARRRSARAAPARATDSGARGSVATVADRSRLAPLVPRIGGVTVKKSSTRKKGEGTTSADGGASQPQEEAAMSQTEGLYGGLSVFLTINNDANPIKVTCLPWKIS